MPITPITIHSIHTGQPRTINDEGGRWQSSIFRELIEGPILLTEGGLVGDKVTDTRHHGSADQAVCCHSMDHYRHWQEVYGADLGAGGVGENWTLLNANEETICIGDIFDVGSARVQVTSPRVPCNTQQRKVKLPNWVNATIAALRTGFYLRVLTPGMVQAGDTLALVERIHPDATLWAVNDCRYHHFDPAFAARLAALPELMGSWQKHFRNRM
ncbi:MAG: MOSC domain-containing protein [Caldilineaceae bacterium]|nr:MOSC domain-containing protein [Caldilineaceae bacterium]MBP8107106.1 MOSC domain-containing protein [Caldilineaceae bacterium]MBP8123628.1 MOSC domain-containing protein [Caldilineaceae bacterium]MBP9072591.1 MOSC domain-containing protein [Caldilineaceae bacterium]